jgi:hypothetical protein
VGAVVVAVEHLGIVRMVVEHGELVRHADLPLSGPPTPVPADRRPLWPFGPGRARAGAPVAGSVRRPRRSFWDQKVTCRDPMCKTAPVLHHSVIIIGRRVG